MLHIEKETFRNKIIDKIRGRQTEVEEFSLRTSSDFDIKKLLESLGVNNSQKRKLETLQTITAKNYDKYWNNHRLQKF